MANEIVPLFDLVEERTRDNGFKFQVWEGVGYDLIWIQYSDNGIDILLTPDKEVSQYLPHIYVRTDDEGRPLYPIIQTTSYGALTIEDYKELQRAMSIAQAAAESVEDQFIHKEEEIMAKVKNSKPILTYAEILVMAGRHIQSEIINLRNECNEMVEKLESAGMQDKADQFRQMLQRQLPDHMERLKAVETLYHIETGSELGYIDEITSDEE